MKFEHTVLANGLSVIAEPNPDALSTAAAFFVRAGARDEEPALAGVSHFLEHMAFKGSDARSADDINRLFDEIGAKNNAYTTEEHTVYYAAILPEFLGETIDLLGDLARPSLRDDDFDVEKKVIIEEIGMYADSPIWSAYEHAMPLFFGRHPLSQSVLGTVDSVTELTSSAMRKYHASRYSPSNMILVAAGNLDWEQLVKLADQHFGDWKNLPTVRRTASHLPVGGRKIIHEPRFTQESLILMSSAPDCKHRLRFAADVLATIIGDEVGSRFHWALAEEGNVDSIDMSFHEYEDAGVFMTSFGCAPELAADNLQVVQSIFDEVTQAGVTDDELSQAKSKIGSRLVLAAERPQNRLFNLGYNWSCRQEYRSLDEDLAALEAVTLHDIRELLCEHPLTATALVALGPMEQLSI